MSQIIDGKKNIQILGDNNNINLETKLFVPTRETTFSAKLSNIYIDLIKYALIICLIISMREISPNLDYMKNYNVLLLLFAMFIADYTSKLISSQFIVMKIKYENNSLYFLNNQYVFYRDIWDIKYTKLSFGFGSCLTIYTYDPYTNVPETHKAMFINDGQAKYIYDSFYNQQKIEEYYKNNK